MEKEKKLKNLIVGTSFLCLAATFIILKFLPAREISQEIKYFPSYILVVIGLIGTLILYILNPLKYAKKNMFCILLPINILFIALLLYFTGGMQSQFFALYLVVIIFSSHIRHMEGALYSTVLTVISYSIIYYFDKTSVDYKLPVFSYHLRFFILVAFFSAYLVRREMRYQKGVKDLLKTMLKLYTQIIDIKKDHIEGHTEEVLYYALKIADALKLTPEEKRHLEFACLFHDIGMVDIRDEILKKKEISSEEKKELQLHIEGAKKYLGKIGGLEDIISIIYSSHERYDGEGYPDGLKEQEIPKLSRILAAAECYTTMLKDRPYRDKLSEDEAIEELIKEKGKQFDPEIVDVFVKMKEEGILLQ